MKRCTTADEADVFARVIAARMSVSPRAQKQRDLRGILSTDGGMLAAPPADRPASAHATVRSPETPRRTSAAGVSTTTPAASPRCLGGHGVGALAREARIRALGSGIALDEHPEEAPVRRPFSRLELDVAVPTKKMNKAKNGASNVVLGGPDDPTQLAKEVYFMRESATISSPAPPASPAKSRPMTAMASPRARKHLESHLDGTAAEPSVASPSRAHNRTLLESTFKISMEIDGSAPPPKPLPATRDPPASTTTTEQKKRFTEARVRLEESMRTHFALSL